MSSDIKLTWKVLKSMANISIEITSYLELLQPDEQMTLVAELFWGQHQVYQDSIPDYRILIYLMSTQSMILNS